MAWLADLWGLARKVDSLLDLERKQGDAIADLQSALVSLEKRVARLENREDIVLTAATAAARTGAMDAMSGQMLQIGGRLAALERDALRIDPPKAGRRSAKRDPA